MPAFQIRTTDGQTYTKGDTNPFGLGDDSARLESADSEGDFVVLTYTGDLTVHIPEHRVQYIAELDG